MSTTLARSLAVFAVLCALVAPLAAAARSTEPVRLAKKAVLEAGADWLMAQQSDEGGYPDLSGTVDPGVTAEVVLTLVDLDHAGIEVEWDDAVAYLERDALVDEERVSGSIAKVVLALVAAGADPRDADGVDLVQLVVDAWDEAAGRYGERPLDHVMAVHALVAAGEEIPDEAVETLLDTQIADGAWAFGGSTDPGTGDTNMTSYVLQALVATGDADDQVVESALSYLRTAQTSEGAFGVVPGAPADANSTGFVISALVAAGENPKSSGWGNAAAALIAFQNEGGAFRYTDQEVGDDILATLTALTALSGGGLAVDPGE